MHHAFFPFWYVLAWCMKASSRVTVWVSCWPSQAMERRGMLPWSSKLFPFPMQYQTFSMALIAFAMALAELSA